MKRYRRLISLLLCLTMIVPTLCTGASASDYSVPNAVKDYLKKGDYFSIFPAEDSSGNPMRYTIKSLTAERAAVSNQVYKGNLVQFWDLGTGKWCIQRENNGVFAIMYVENREDHAGGASGSSPKYWALNHDNTSSGTYIHMWEDSNHNDKEKTFYLEEDNDGDPETFYLCSAHAYGKKSSARYIAPSDRSYKEGSKIVLSSSPYHWRISIVSRVTGANDNIDWMSRLDGSLRLSEINIPGTHDSCTANIKASYAENANNYTCQMHFIDEQLINGVRAFDIRYCYNEGDKDVFTCHGSGSLRCATPESDGSKAMTVDWVISKILLFLDNERAKNETIIMVVKQDDSNKDAPKYMAETLLEHENDLYDWSNPSPTLDDVRGKIVVMSRTDFSGVVAADKLKYFGPNISNWDNSYDDDSHWAQKIGNQNDPVEAYIQDDYESPDNNKKTQVENVIKQLSGQKASMSGVEIKDVPDIPDSAFCFNYTSMTASIDPNPLGAARVMNRWLCGDASKYFKNGGYRTGIMMMDYCDEILCDLVIASNTANRSHTCAFNDISEDDWFHDSVEKASELGLMNGTGGNQFSPQKSMNGAMPAQILYNREGRPEVEIEDGFDPAAWYAPAVSWGIQQGLINADGFTAEGSMSRQNMISMIYNYAKLKGYDTSAAADLSGFADASQVSPDAEAAVRWAVDNGIISGNDQKQLLPEDGVLRCDAAKIFVKFAELQAP